MERAQSGFAYDRIPQNTGDPLQIKSKAPSDVPFMSLHLKSKFGRRSASETATVRDPVWRGWPMTEYLFPAFCEPTFALAATVSHLVVLPHLMHIHQHRRLK